jgi:hypothetical protein
MKRSGIWSLKFGICFVIGVLFGFGVLDLGFTPPASAAHTWEVGQDPTTGATRRFIIKDALGSGELRRLVIGATGNVGIGTMEPTSKLTVLGTIEIMGAGNVLKFPDNTTQETAGVSQWTPTTSHIYNKNAGSVCIGTADPTLGGGITGKLVVQVPSATEGLKIKLPSNTPWSPIVVLDSNNNVIYKVDQNGSFYKGDLAIWFGIGYAEYWNFDIDTGAPWSDRYMITLTSDVDDLTAEPCIVSQYTVGSAQYIRVRIRTHYQGGAQQTRHIYWKIMTYT